MLSGTLLEQTAEALLEAFPLDQELDSVVDYADIGVSFNNFTRNAPVNGAVRQLLKHADAKGEFTKLVATAFRLAPRNPKLRAVWAQFSPLNAELTAIGTDLPTFEKVLFSARPFEDVGPFLSKLAAARRAVCRVEPQPSTQGLLGYGTGFLVGPDVVMTNAHVADEFWGQDDHCRRTARVVATQVRFRFDAETDAHGVEDPGTEVSLATQFKIAYSDRSDLDYALLRLERVVGDGGGRGWLSPTAYSFTPGIPEPLLLLQHPGGKPLKLAFGTLELTVPPARRVRYAMNSQGGSSGSPVFTQALEVVAIHHAEGGTLSNEGVPFDAIKADWRKPVRKAALTAAGLEHLL